MPYATVKRMIAAALSSALLAACAAPEAPPKKRFVIFYGDAFHNKPEETAKTFSGYDLLVFQPAYHPPLKALGPQQVALAYVSIGEAYEGKLPDELEDIALHDHELWNSRLVDIRDERWHQFVIEEKITPALNNGFNGVMLDTVDSAIHLERTEPEQFKGMQDAAVKLIAGIRKAHPGSLIMLNRGFEIWGDAGPHLDMLLAESILSSHNFDSGESFLVPAGLYQQQLDKIRKARAQYPHLTVYSVDYWDMNDRNGVLLLYQRQRENGLIPYVSDPKLNTAYPEPASKARQSGLLSGMTGERDA